MFSVGVSTIPNVAVTCKLGSAIKKKNQPRKYYSYVWNCLSNLSSRPMNGPRTPWPLTGSRCPSYLSLSRMMWSSKKLQRLARSGDSSSSDHGISPSLIQRLKEVGQEFFELPQEEKEAYANEAASGKFEGYGTKMTKNLEEKVEWIDYYFHVMASAFKVNYDVWPKNPPAYRWVVHVFFFFFFC